MKNRNWQAIAAKHPKFIYQKYQYEINQTYLHISCHFVLDPDIQFGTSLIIHNIDQKRFAIVPKEVIDNLVFNLGMVELISYYKAAVPKEIVITAGSLTADQIAWWKDLFIEGLGEFAFHNSIDLDYLRQISLTAAPDTQARYDEALQDRALIPIGGGKDSAVVSQLVKDRGKEANALLVNPTQASGAVAATAGFTAPIMVKRSIDTRLLKLNEQGYLNGHTPFSAVLAFVGVLTAVLFDYSDIVLANERSANQGNVVYQGHKVNHQYSKTFRFENKFHDYAQRYLAKQVNYFSMLRPLYELQIAQRFAKYPQYFSTFRSCNAGQKTNSWCGNCAKCLFVYIILYPFLGKEELLVIFGKGLYADESLLPILKELLGVANQKPFDCVGTYEEVQAALYLSLRDKRDDQTLLTYFEQEILPKYPTIAQDSQKILTDWNNDNLVPPDYQKLLQ